MTGLGQSRHFGRRPTTSGLPLETDIVRAGRHVSNVPTRDIGLHLVGASEQRLRDFEAERLAVFRSHLDGRATRSSLRGGRDLASFFRIVSTVCPEAFFSRRLTTEIASRTSGCVARDFNDSRKSIPSSTSVALTTALRLAADNF